MYSKGESMFGRSIPFNKAWMTICNGYRWIGGGRSKGGKGRKGSSHIS